jgi:hypothetical protein
MILILHHPSPFFFLVFQCAAVRAYWRQRWGGVGLGRSQIIWRRESLVLSNEIIQYSLVQLSSLFTFPNNGRVSWSKAGLNSLIEDSQVLQPRWSVVRGADTLVQLDSAWVHRHVPGLMDWLIRAGELLQVCGPREMRQNSQESESISQKKYWFM